MWRSPRNGRSSGEHVAVPCALLSSRIASPWNGPLSFSRKPNSFGLGSRVRKMVFFSGESPLYEATIARASMKISRMETPEGQFA